MPDRKKSYLDANVMLSYVNGDVDRLPTVDAILAEGKTYWRSLYTSMLSQVEVAFGAAEQATKALDEETEKKIDSLWLPGSPIRLVEYYRLIGDDARSLMRVAISKGWSLKPMDAIHLGTARRQEVDEFLTYDPALEKYAEVAGFNICEPYAVQPMLPELPPGGDAPSDQAEQ